MKIQDYINEAMQMNEEYLVEMAIINPKLCRNLTIQVEVEQRDEGPIPHIHVYHDKTRNPKKCSYVRLDIAEYAPHHDIIPLPRKLKKEFLKYASAPSGDYMKDNEGNIVELTGYQSAVKTWVETFEDDYSKFQLDEKGIIVPLDYKDL